MTEELKEFEAVYQMIVKFFVESSFQILAAIIIFIVGFLLAKKFSTAVFNLCQRKGIDITLSKFIANVCRLVLVAIITIIALGKMNISVTPLVAAIGALSLGAGLAVQGLLSNYSSGLNIIITRPFVVGDTISVKGVTGVVREVLLAHTLLVDEDDVEITIPNKHIVGEIIHNSHGQSLIELSIGVAYSSDIKQVLALAENAMAPFIDKNNNRLPLVGIASFDDSAITLAVRLWAPTVKIHQIEYAANQALISALTQGGIEIPFPQREIKML